MAIFGIGAYFSGGQGDVSERFISEGLACIGWGEDEAPTLHEILRYIKLGDIIYIKSNPINQGLRIKAVGIVTDNNVIENSELGSGVRVRWIWTGLDIQEIEDIYNVRNNTIYEEHNRDVQTIVLNHLISEFN
ncbi:MAG: hypothetical protein ACLQQ4_08975 [Bacteroidia bacterium]